MLLDPDLISRTLSLEFKAKRIVEGFMSGLHKSPHHGYSVEFAEHRAYQPGDEFRHLDWKLYGKTERFYVKRYMEETNLRAHLFLDMSSSMNFHHFTQWSKLEYGVHLAAALFHLLHRQRDAFGLVTFDSNIQKQYPARSSGSHLHLLNRELESLLNRELKQPDGHRTTAVADSLRSMAARLQRRSVIILISDLIETVADHNSLLSALKELRYKNHEVILFNLLEFRSEREFDFPAGELKVRDMETGEAISVSPTVIRKRYKEEVEGYMNRFRSECGEASIVLEELDIAAPFDRALLAWLRARASSKSRGHA
jgi:uncharacterized protein (DUF58 family)